MFIKPRAGLKIRNPISMQFIPESGMEVGDHDVFWHRLLNDEDVEVVTEKDDAHGE